MKHLTISSLLLLCSLALAFAGEYQWVMPSQSLRCALNESELGQASNFDLFNNSDNETWTAILITYEKAPPPGEISRCVNEIANSKPTQRYLSSFVDAMRRKRYKGRARQWEIRVGDKIACFLGVPR